MGSVMLYEKKRDLYDAAPNILKQAVLLVPFSFIAGKSYRMIMKRMSWFDMASRQQIKKYQESELRKMLTFAVENIPAYSCMRSAVSRYEPFDALKEFPLVTKEIIRSDIDKYTPKCISKIQHYKARTSGTTGEPMVLNYDNESQSIELGFIHRQWSRVGYFTKAKKATFRGLSGIDIKDGVYWKDNPIYSEVQFSPFHMKEENLWMYYDKMKRFQPSFLHGYSSSIDLLAEYLIRNNITYKDDSIKAALLGSEAVSKEQRERIEFAFNTKVYSWYGHSERVILAGECEYDKAYHHMPDYGVLQIIGGNGELCEKEGESGEITGTGFFNKSLPLIRYKTGDYATRLDSKCKCGRSWDRFADVVGRSEQSYLLGYTGERISLTTLGPSSTSFDKVKRYQYYQNSPGLCVIRVVVTNGFDESNKIELEEKHNRLTVGSVKFIVEIVDELFLTKSGKWKYLYSEIK